MELNKSQSYASIEPYYKILNKIEGNIDCLNDVVIFKCNELKSKYNIIYFGGDIQNYEDEMKKNSTCRLFTEWNLINTGKLLFKNFTKDDKSCANVFIIRAEYFHLKCFANYSNFVPSTDFGIPIGNPNDFESKLDQNEEGSISSEPVACDILSNKLRCIEHLQALYLNSILEFNSQEMNKIDESLPIILCGFSKGCVVLNQFCTEMSLIRSNLDISEQTCEFLKQVRHIFWLDGGHSGTSNSWLTGEEIIKSIKDLNYSCYVYVTPYQLKSPKYWAIQEYEKFIELLKKFDVNIKNLYYFKEKEDDDYDVNLHFELLKHFDSNLIN